MCVCKPTELFDKLLHVEVEGVNDGASRLVVVMIDGYSGKAASDLPLLEHVHLDLRAKVLAHEMGRGAASYPRPDHRWSAEDQSQPQTGSVKLECGLECGVCEMCCVANDHPLYGNV